ncbi:serine kinase [Niveispirillum sp. KHB5.9]|uniref:serine kinase n=1 Tax=Niveispirillum sp. KHB5.9 TaxID=3400269 RepID=UPI003A8AEE10
MSWIKDGPVGPGRGGGDMAGECRYRIYGLTLSSPRPLPFLWPEPDPARPADAVLRFAPVAIPVETPLRQARRLSVYADGTGLHQAVNGARFLIREGREITVDLPAGTSEAELHALLCGPPLGWLMCQRGLPPMHACVVAVGPVAVALAGDSGAGKSTLARTLVGRGHGLVTDDQAVIDPATGLVLPGYPAMKLWDGTAALAGDAVDPGRRVRAGLEKYYIPMPDAFRPAPLPLGLVLVLSKGAERRLERADPHEAAALLLRCLYRPEFSRGLDEGRIALQWGVTLARAVPVFRLERSDDLADLPTLADAVEALADA